MYSLNLKALLNSVTQTRDMAEIGLYHNIVYHHMEVFFLNPIRIYDLRALLFNINKQS